MIHKRPEKDTVNPPGQIINRPPAPDTLQHNIEQWKQYEQQRNCPCTKVFDFCRCEQALKQLVEDEGNSSRLLTKAFIQQAVQQARTADRDINYDMLTALLNQKGEGCHPS